MKKKPLQRRRSRPRSLRKHVERLTLLGDLGRILNSTLDQKEVRRRAIEAVTRLMEAEVGSLLLVDEERNQLYFEVALGDEEEEIKKITLKMGEGIAGWVAQRGEPLIVNAPDQDPRFFNGVDGKTEFKTRNLICVPVKVKERVIGVLEAINKEGKKPFDQEDLSLFSSLGDWVAIALDNARVYQELEEVFFQTSESLADAIEKRDPYTGGHTQRVTSYSLAIAKHLSLTPQEKKLLRIASVLHDVGKIGIDDSILRKPEPLSRDEYEAIKRHAAMGAQIVEHVRKLWGVIPGVKYHHEQMDGGGYPEGLRGADIPLLAKIVAVADAYDAMTTDRPYRLRMDEKVVIDDLKRHRGTKFDRKVVGALLKAYRKGDLKSEVRTRLQA